MDHGGKIMDEYYANTIDKHIKDIEELTRRIQGLERTMTLMSGLMTNWFHMLVKKDLITIEDIDNATPSSWNVVVKEE